MYLPGEERLSLAVLWYLSSPASTEPGPDRDG